MPMYELLLAANIVWEFALAHRAETLLVVAAIAVALVIALARGRPGWRRALPAAATVAVVASAAAFFAVPRLTGASFADFGYWVDWANLLAIAACAGVVVAAVVWPLLASAMRRAR